MNVCTLQSRNLELAEAKHGSPDGATSNSEATAVFLGVETTNTSSQVRPHEMVSEMPLGPWR